MISYNKCSGPATSNKKRSNEFALVQFFISDSCFNFSMFVHRINTETKNIHVITMRSAIIETVIRSIHVYTTIVQGLKHTEWRSNLSLFTEDSKIFDRLQRRGGPCRSSQSSIKTAKIWSSNWSTTSFFMQNSTILNPIRILPGWTYKMTVRPDRAVIIFPDKNIQCHIGILWGKVCQLAFVDLVRLATFSRDLSHMGQLRI